MNSFERIGLVDPEYEYGSQIIWDRVGLDPMKNLDGHYELSEVERSLVDTLGSRYVQTVDIQAHGLAVLKRADDLMLKRTLDGSNEYGGLVGARYYVTKDRHGVEQTTKVCWYNDLGLATGKVSRTLMSVVGADIDAPKVGIYSYRPPNAGQPIVPLMMKGFVLSQEDRLAPVEGIVMPYNNERRTLGGPYATVVEDEVSFRSLSVVDARYWRRAHIDPSALAKQEVVEFLRLTQQLIPDNMAVGLLEEPTTRQEFLEMIAAAPFQSLMNISKWARDTALEVVNPRYPLPREVTHV